jgi:hypothetical protein
LGSSGGIKLPGKKEKKKDRCSPKINKLFSVAMVCEEEKNAETAHHPHAQV